MRCIFTTSVIAIITAKSILALPESKSLDSSYYDVPEQQFKDALKNRTQAENESIEVKGAIPQRELLLLPRMQPKESLHVKPPTPPKRKCQHTTLRKGQVRQLEDCDEGIYTIFAQTYMPTFVPLEKSNHGRVIHPEDVEDWNNNLKIYGLWPQHSKVKSALPFSTRAYDAVHQYDWSIDVNYDEDHGLYAKEWEKSGVHSGLSPIDYIREAQSLHHFHTTPHVLRESTTETSIPLTKFIQGFHPYACLVCKVYRKEKYFLGVHYCHQVNPENYKVNEAIVPYEKCGTCSMRCDWDTIVVPKLNDQTSKCQGDVCNEYTVFSQTYMPTFMTTGKLDLRKPEPAEVNDWNNNLKIHTLWPKHYKVKPSTLPFTPQAAAIVDEKEWPTVQTQSPKQYEQQWNKNGINTGLNPLEYVLETQRVHQLHPTPDMLKGVFPNKQLIPLATLKMLFNANACLICRRNGDKELFLAMHICYKVNPKSRQMEEVVPYSNCGTCFGCRQQKIIIPKLPEIKSNVGVKRKRDKI